TKSQPSSRSPSPSRFFTFDKGHTEEYKASKKLAESTTQAVRVTKKVVGANKKLTPNITAKSSNNQQNYLKVPGPGPQKRVSNNTNKKGTTGTENAGSIKINVPKSMSKK